MATNAAARALDDLERQALLWLVGQSDFEPLVQGACDLLALGIDGDALAALAGLSVHEDRWSSNVDLDDAIASALDEQGRPLAPRGTHDAQAAAVVAMTAEVLAGRLSPCDLATWAHRVVGHQGAAMAQPLVDLADRYDMGEYLDEPGAGLDGQVLAFCQAV